MRFNKDDASAMIGSILIHLVLLLILFFTILRTITPNEDSGILVNFGDLTAATGTQEPQYSAARPQREIPPQPRPKPTPVVEKEMLTQEEESVKIEEAKVKAREKKEAEEQARRERAEAERIRREEEERKRKEEEQRKQEEAISNVVTSSFGKGAAQQSQQGKATAGEGNEGNPFGNSDTGPNTGTGGYGSFDLGGRGIGSGGLPRPEYNGKDDGTIVIDITVDPAGNVVNAKIGQGTKVTDSAIRESALSAARRAKFNKIEGSNNQSGKITYYYKYI
ncbi:MAG: energy transducer TonB [Tannerella sp.]|jgi:TonB family protein|nr:energy transducer TonB [Tannerella sp.]